ncbi:hypothetical protein [Aquimarina sp. RZ0]|uniref:hypothetical protein n=1 Tax=Aquimarina sp. RZ0 TaxID=2607730 RepID=UPI0011F0B2A5|nr:hypothetical protein [Aquimarina sp. RZ0]KAA1243901.1 hypothetical protein F0000_18740 [Aquimarina sp. RZ0]
MSNEFEVLQNQWKKGKIGIENTERIMEQTLVDIQVKKRWSVHFYYGNSIILLCTLIGISAFFYFVAPVERVVSRIGVGLMTGGLLIRIIIEIISIKKSKRIRLIHTTLKTTNDTMSFYRFRKTIHGPVTIAIIIMYTIGFYMITPEFSVYLKNWYLVFICTSYIVGAFILIKVIRKNIKKEIQILLDMVKLRKHIIEKT